MKYLVIDHFLRGTYVTNDLTKQDLVHKKEGLIKMIINLIEKTYFDPEKNSWEEIPKR